MQGGGAPLRSAATALPNRERAERYSKQEAQILARHRSELIAMRTRIQGLAEGWGHSPMSGLESPPLLATQPEIFAWS